MPRFCISDDLLFMITLFQIHTGWDDSQRFAASVTSTGGSNAELLSSKEIQTGWMNSSDFLASTFAFTLSYHSLLSLPMMVLRYGGLSFLLLYTLMLIILACPLLLLEMFLG